MSHHATCVRARAQYEHCAISIKRFAHTRSKLSHSHSLCINMSSKTEQKYPTFASVLARPRPKPLAGTPIKLAFVPIVEAEENLPTSLPFKPDLQQCIEERVIPEGYIACLRPVKPGHTHPLCDNYIEPRSPFQPGTEASWPPLPTTRARLHLPSPSAIKVQSSSATSPTVRYIPAGYELEDRKRVDWRRAPLVCPLEELVRIGKTKGKRRDV